MRSWRSTERRPAIRSSSGCARLIPRRAIWFTEDPYEYYRNARVAGLFDLVFTNDAATAANYSQRRDPPAARGQPGFAFLPGPP